MLVFKLIDVSKRDPSSTNKTLECVITSILSYSAAQCVSLGDSQMEIRLHYILVKN